MLLTGKSLPKMSTQAGSAPLHRSSDGFAALAAALVKVQAEFDNPEISQMATTLMARTGEGEGASRRASLANGLDTVRKTLGKHELATVQTTSIDGAVGM